MFPGVPGDCIGESGEGMSPEDLLKLTTASLSAKMLGEAPIRAVMPLESEIRIISHKEYRVGDMVFSTYREAYDYLIGAKVYIIGAKEYRVGGKVFTSYRTAEEYLKGRIV